MRYTRRAVAGGALALLAPFTGCTQLVGRGGQVDVTVFDDSAEDVEGAPRYEEIPISGVEVGDETVDEARERYDREGERVTTAAEVNELQLRRASDALADSNAVEGEEWGAYFAGDGVYVVVLLKEYT